MPLAYICSHEAQTYFRMIQILKERLKSSYNVEWNPVACVSDFETGFISALTDHNIGVHGCKWHYLDAIKRRMRLLAVAFNSEMWNAILKVCVELFYADSRETFTTKLEEVKSKSFIYYVFFFIYRMYLHMYKYFCYCAYVSAVSAKVPDFYSPYFVDYWIGKDFVKAKNWGSWWAFQQNTLPDEWVEIIKAHDTNAFSEGRNSADRQLFASEVSRTYRSKNARLTLLEQVTYMFTY